MSRLVEKALAECLARVESGEATVEEALRGYSDLRSELEPLLRLAVGLGDLPQVSAPDSLRTFKRPVFTTPQAVPVSVRRRLPLIGWQLLRPTPAWITPGARLAAALVLTVMLLGGTMVASAGSLPEEPLYPLKLAMESAQLALTPDPQRRAELEMQFAGRRLQEVESAAREGRIQVVEQGLALYEKRVEGALDTVQSTGAVPSGESRQIEDSLERQQETLARVYTQVPAAAQPAIQRAMEVSQQGATRGGKKAVDGDTDGKAAPTSQPGTVVPAAPVPTQARPTEVPVPDKGHEPSDETRPAVSPTSTPEPREAAGERVDSSNGEKDSDRGRGQDRDEQKSRKERESSSPQPLVPIASHSQRLALVTPTPRPSPTATAVATPTPPVSATATPERPRQEGDRGHDADRSSRSPVTVVRDDGGDANDNNMNENDHDRDGSSRGSSR